MVCGWVRVGAELVCARATNGQRHPNLRVESSRTNRIWPSDSFAVAARSHTIQQQNLNLTTCCQPSNGMESEPNARARQAEIVLYGTTDSLFQGRGKVSGPRGSKRLSGVFSVRALLGCCVGGAVEKGELHSAGLRLGEVIEEAGGGGLAGGSFACRWRAVGLQRGAQRALH